MKPILPSPPGQPKSRLRKPDMARPRRRYNATMLRTRSLSTAAGLIAGLGILALLAAGPARACPFCSAVSLTFAQEIAQSEAAVIARLVEPPPASALGPAAEGPLPKGKFEVVEVLKGGDLVAAAGHAGGGGEPIETIMLEEQPVGTTLSADGRRAAQARLEQPDPGRRTGGRLPRAARRTCRRRAPSGWPSSSAISKTKTTPSPATPTTNSPWPPTKTSSPRRIGSTPRQLLAWIEDPDVQANRRRLYATMLGICGTAADAERIAAILEGQGAAADQARGAKRPRRPDRLLRRPSRASRPSTWSTELFLDREPRPTDGERAGVPSPKHTRR